MAMGKPGGMVEDNRSGMKRVLIVSYFFPPMNVVAALRAGKMAKYLPDYGWQPAVLTVVPPPAIPLGIPVEVPESQVVRTPYLRPPIRKAPPGWLSSEEGLPSPGRQWVERVYQAAERMLRLNLVRMPDRTLGWYPYAVRAGVRLHRRVHFDAIYSSAGPPTSHLVASRLQKTFGVPWVADYRDLWSHNHYQLRGPMWQWLEERFERHVIRRAAHLVTVTPPLAERLQTFSGQRVTVIPNGFDAADFEDLEPGVSLPGSLFTLLYAGTVYPVYQDPTMLFRAVRELLVRAQIQPGEFLIRFVGTDPEYVSSLATEHDVADLVSISPRVPYRESLKLQTQATALLLFKWTDVHETGVCPAKLFEYLGARRPVLAVGTKRDVVDDILQECRAGVAVTSLEETVHALDGWLNTFRHQGQLPCAASMEHVCGYTRAAAARRLAGVLDEEVARWCSNHAEGQ